MATNGIVLQGYYHREKNEVAEFAAPAASCPEAQIFGKSAFKPADRVADYVADSGYFTRLFSSVVGPKGYVYAVEPTSFFKYTAALGEESCRVFC